jgi:hypothetical protein
LFTETLRVVCHWLTVGPQAVKDISSKEFSKNEAARFMMHLLFFPRTLEKGML